MMHVKHDNPRDFRRTGITLMETVLSLLILGGAFVASLNTIASARGAQAIVSQRQLGLVLAEDLMDEILAHSDYQEGALFGPEVGEALAGRAAFDAVDDFDGWQFSPPVDESNNRITGTTGYMRSVEVNYVLPSDLKTISATDQGVLRITVTVSHKNKIVATLVAYRTDAWQGVN